LSFGAFLVPKFVALLRGVNVGRANRVPMADFRRILESLGFDEVRTLLNSGNAVFTGRAHSPQKIAQQIRARLQSDLDVDVLTIVKSRKEMAAIERENTLVKGATDPSRLLVAFAADHAGLQSLKEIAPLIQRPERFLLGQQAAYFWCPKGILKSVAAEALLGKRGPAVTTRNWATVMKLNALLDEAP
jgi:uncharacterized protein (DUF1697 family)